MSFIEAIDFFLLSAYCLPPSSNGRKKSTPQILFSLNTINCSFSLNTVIYRQTILYVLHLVHISWMLIKWLGDKTERTVVQQILHVTMKPILNSSTGFNSHIAGSRHNPPVIIFPLSHENQSSCFDKEEEKKTLFSINFTILPKNRTAQHFTTMHPHRQILHLACNTTNRLRSGNSASSLAQFSCTDVTAV